MAKSRVPHAVAARVKLASDRRCCVCHKQGDHIHHLDGNHENHELKNLALLCFDCHHEATMTGGLKRKLTATDIREFRSNWYSQVESRRHAWANQLAREPSIPTSPGEFSGAIIDALAISEIRTFESDHERGNWPTLISELNRLLKYCDFRYGSEVKTELLNSLYSVTSHVRFRMPYRTAAALDNLISAALPITSIVGPMRELSIRDLDQMEIGCHLAFNIAYDGLLKLSNLAILDLGLNVLWSVLRVACINDLDGTEQVASEQFQRLRETAKRSSAGIRSDAIRWIDFREADARDFEGHNGYEYPGDIETQIGELSM